MESLVCLDSPVVPELELCLEPPDKRVLKVPLEMLELLVHLAAPLMGNLVLLEKQEKLDGQECPDPKVMMANLEAPGFRVAMLLIANAPVAEVQLSLLMRRKNMKKSRF